MSGADASSVAMGLRELDRLARRLANEDAVTTRHVLADALQWCDRLASACRGNVADELPGLDDLRGNLRHLAAVQGRSTAARHLRHLWVLANLERLHAERLQANRSRARQAQADSHPPVSRAQSTSD